MLQDLDILAKPSLVYEHAHESNALQIVACCERFLSVEYRDFVLARQSSPLCTWYASDGTEHR